MAAMTGMQVTCPACCEQVGLHAQLLLADPRAGECIVKLDTKPLRDHIATHNAMADTAARCSSCGTNGTACLDGLQASATACCKACSEGDTHAA